jgi:hypothetical protein
MTEKLAERVVVGQERRLGRRRLAVIAAAALVLITSSATVLELHHLDHQFGPIQSGNFGGPYSNRGFVFSKDGTSYSLASTRRASGQLIASISNRGHHSVKIMSIDTDNVASAIRWSAYRTVPGGSVEGTNTPWQSFPTVVPGQGTIRLLITIHHPANCHAYPQGSDYYSGLHTVHWHSLLHTHTTTIDDGLAQDDIRFC